VPNIVGLQIVNRDRLRGFAVAGLRLADFLGDCPPRRARCPAAGGDGVCTRLWRLDRRTLGHAFGDANAFWYPYLWSWGGKEVEADGKTVVLNSKETIESVKFAVGLWKDACDESALAWDDSGNNRAFLAGTISATNNDASIYLKLKRSPTAI
jgi:ABC-type glycerol-3-phosphate transport system substrate-binding protein